MQKIFVFGVMLVALFLGLVFIYNAENEIIRIQYTGERAIVGSIEDFEETDMSFGENIHTATFHFKTSDGRSITKASSFPSELLDDIKNHQPVVVCYRPNDPEHFFFERFKPSIYLFLFVVLLFHVIVFTLKNSLIDLKAQRRVDEVRILAAHLERK